MADPRGGHEQMAIASQETIKARDDVEAATGQARDLVLDFLAEHGGEAPVSDVLKYLADRGVRSDSTISDALVRLLAARDVRLDENRRLSIAS